MEAPAVIAGCRHARNPHHRCSELCRAVASEGSRQQQAPRTPPGGKAVAAAGAAQPAPGDDGGCCSERAGGHAAPAERTLHDAGCRAGGCESEAETALFASLAGASVQGAQPAEQACGDATQRAEALRAQGNAHFTAGLYREATEAYSAAIKLLDGSVSDDDSPARADLLAACLSNRAAAWLRRKRWAEALADCNGVLRSGRVNGVMLKALFRRGKAHEGLGNADAALADFKRVVELEPNNAAAREEVDNYGSILHRLVVMSYCDADTRRRQQGGV